MARSYSGDPYWIACKYPGKCSQCGKAIEKGNRAFRYKNGDLLGEACGCGEQASREFQCAAADEDLMSGYGGMY